jgi:hypothetical protein
MARLRQLPTRDATVKKGTAGKGRKPFMPNAFGGTLNARSYLSPELILRVWRAFNRYFNKEV